MPQSSAPIVNVNLSDADWRDLFGDEAGVVGDIDGSAYAVTLPTDSDVASFGSTTQRSMSRVAGFAHRIPSGETETITIPAATGAARTDIVAARYDPAFTGAPGPVRLVRIAGTTSAIPTHDDAAPGVEDLPLWAITRSPGQALSQATVRRLFTRLAPSLDLQADASLPLSSPLGTIARQGSRTYRRALATTGVPAWALTPSDTGWLNLPLRSPFTAVTADSSTALSGARYKVRDNTCWFTLRFSRSSPWSTPITVADFPVGARPVHGFGFRATKDNTDGLQDGLFVVLPTGAAQLNIPGQDNNSVYVSGSFPTD